MRGAFFFVFLLLFFVTVSFSATLSVDSNEAWMTKVVRISGGGFTPDTNLQIGNTLEPSSAWWDGYNEQWGFPIVNVTTNASGDFNYDWTIPFDFRLSPGKQYFSVANKLKGAIYWNGEGYTTQKNGVWCDGTSCFTVSSYTNPNGGVEKFNMLTGARECNITIAVNGNDIVGDGTYVYSVHDGATNNFRRTLASNCSGTTAFTLNPATAAAITYSIKLDSTNTNAYLTYSASKGPLKYTNLTTTPAIVAGFNPTVVASIAYDICISPDDSKVYAGFADGNVRAYNSTTGALLWNSDPDDSNVTLAVLGLACDANKVYLSKGLNNTAVGPFFGGAVEALDANNGSLVWRVERNNNLYNYGQYNNLRCDAENCYAVVQQPVLGGAGTAGGPIIQINKTTGAIGYILWRSWLPTAGAYGNGTAHASPQTLWIDSDVNGSMYPIYSTGRIQKLAKQDVNVQSFPDTNIWIRSNTNLYNFIMNPTKNVFLSNERPEFNFKATDGNGLSLNTDDNRFYSSYLRYSTINAFDEYTATETASSQFLDPRITTAFSTSATAQPNPTPYNYLYFAYDQFDQLDASVAPGHCPSTVYTNRLFGWHQLGRYCLYENLDLNHPTLTHTQNGVMLSATEFALTIPKKWDDFPIVKTFGTDNWAWLSDHNSAINQVLGFVTRFGKDQNEVWTDNLGRATKFINTAAATSYIYDYVNATQDFNNANSRLQVWHENYFLFKPKGSGLDGNRHWEYVEEDTNMIANPITVVQGANTSGTFVIPTGTFSNLVEFNAREPIGLARTNEPFWFDVNFVDAIRSDCADLVVTDDSNTAIDLWQLDANTCVANNYYTLFVQDNFTAGQDKNYKLYYNSSALQVLPGGTSDLAVANVTGTCAAGTSSLDVNSNHWFAWYKPGVGGATEQLRFKFGENQTSTWWNHATTRYQMNVCYKNSQTANTGAGAVTDTCGTALALFASRCYQISYNNNKIFTRIDMNTGNFTLTPHLGTAQVRKIMTKWYFFNNNGRVRVMSKLDQPLPMRETGISRDYAPYYFFGTYSLVPQGSVADDFLNWGGRKELMDAYTPATISQDKKNAVLRPSPLPMMFTIDYAGNAVVNTTSEATKTTKGCSVHKLWPYYSWRPLGATISTGATTFATAYTTDFISCHADYNASIAPLGNDGYVNAFPKESIYGTGLNKFIDPNLIAKFYLKPNLFIPDNRENRWLPPLALNAQYAATAKVSTYILDVCPSKEYGYKGFDDFLLDVPNLIASTSTHLVLANRNNIPCATSIVKFSTTTGSNGTYYLFQKDVNVIVGENFRPDAPYPSNLYSATTGGLSVTGALDYTFAQKAAYYYGKWFFTSSGSPWVIHAYTTTGAEQLAGQTRYAWGPSFFYNKKAYDQSSFWNKSDYNMTYYQSPCNWNIGSSPYGDMDLGPGWVNNFSTASVGTVCPRNTDNVEQYASFRPAAASLYSGAAVAAVWEDIVIDGRPNKPTVIGDLGTNAALYSRHNGLWDYSHYSDYTQVVDSLDQLNEGVKHTNDQPWMCNFSKADSKSFCMIPITTTSLIYTYGAGALTATQPWSAYYQSDREYSVLRRYVFDGWTVTANFNPTYDFLTERAVYPMLASNEVTYDMLYTSNDPMDYNNLFKKVFPRLHNAMYQTQFLITDWKNNAFFNFNRDTREYLRGQVIDVNGFILKNSNNLASAPIIVQVYKNSAPSVPITTYQTTTDAQGNFTYSYTVPNTADPGLYFIKANYNNDDVNGVATFKVSSFAINVALNKTAYVAGDYLSITATVTDAITNSVVSDAALALTIQGPSGNNIVNGLLMTNQGVGNYFYEFILDANTNNGVYTISIDAQTLSNTGTATAAFGVSSEVGEIQITNNPNLSDANTSSIIQTAILQNVVAGAVTDYSLNYILSNSIDFNKIRSVRVGSSDLNRTTSFSALDSTKYYLSYDTQNNKIIYLKQNFVQNESKTVTLVAENKYFVQTQADYNSAQRLYREASGYCAALVSSDAQTICQTMTQRVIDINYYYAQALLSTKAGEFYDYYNATHEQYTYLLSEIEQLRAFSLSFATCEIFLPDNWKLDSNISFGALMLAPGRSALTGAIVEAKLYSNEFNLVDTLTLNEFNSGWYYKVFASPSSSNGYSLVIDQNIAGNNYKCAAAFDVNQSSGGAASITGDITGGGLSADQNATLYQILALVLDINATTHSMQTTITTINNTLNTVNGKIDSIQSSLADMNNRLIEIDSNVIYIKGNLGGTTDLTDINAKLNQILAYSIDINSTTSSTNTQVTTLQTTVVDVNTSLATLRSTVLDINSTLNACTLTPTLSICGKLDSLLANVSDLNTTLQSVKLTTLDINQTASSTNNTVTSMNNTVNTINSTVNSISTMNSLILSKVNSIDGNVLLSLAELDAIKNLQDCSSQPASSVCDKLNALSQSLADINSSNTDSFLGITSSLSSISASNLSIDGNLQSVLAELNCAAPDAGDVCTRLITLEGYTDSLEGSFTSLSADVSIIENTVNDINTGVNANSLAISDTNATLQTILSGVNSSNTEINEIQIMLLDVNARIVGIQNTLDLNVVSVLNGLVVDVDSIKQSNTSITNSLAIISQNIIDINTVVQSTSQLVSSINALVTTINGTVNSISTTVGAINTKTDTLQLGITEINALVGAIDSNVNYISSVMATKTDIADLNNGISGLMVLAIDTNAVAYETKTIAQETRTSITDLNSTLNSVHALATDINAIVSACSVSHSASICGKLDSLALTLFGMNSTLSQVSLTATDINSVVYSTASTLSTLSSTSTSILSTVTDINSKTDQLVFASTDINSTLNSTLTAILDANAGITLARSDISSLSSAASSNTLLLQDVNSTLYSVKSSIDNSVVPDINTIKTTTQNTQTQTETISTTVQDINSSQQQIISSISSMQSTLSTVSDTVNNIRTSQTQNFRVILSDYTQIAPGDKYRAKVWVYDYNGSPLAADALPTITLYDPARNTIVTSASMALEEAGVYTYEFTSTSSQTAGQWESIASVIVKGTTAKPSDFWELTGNPPEVKINSITDATIPGITASVTIQNEGTSVQEYQYEYCVVSEQTNQCGGSDDVDYQSGAKLITPGQIWNTNLSLNVATAGAYYFKVKVYYGTERSAATKQFTATSGGSGAGSGTGGGSTGSGSSGSSGGSSGATGLITLPSLSGEIIIEEFPSEVVVHAGEVSFAKIIVRNTGMGLLDNLSLILIGIFPDWYTITQTENQLTTDSTAEFLIKFAPPESALTKDNTIRARISSGNLFKEKEFVLRVFNDTKDLIKFVDLTASDFKPLQKGSIIITLQNVSNEEQSIEASVLLPLDWSSKEEQKELTLAPGEKKELIFYVVASDNVGVQSFVVDLRSKEGKVLTSSPLGVVSKEFLIMTKSEASGLPIPRLGGFLEVNVVGLVLIILVIAIILILGHKRMINNNTLSARSTFPEIMLPKKKWSLSNEKDSRLASLEDKIRLLEEKIDDQKEMIKGLARKAKPLGEIIAEKKELASQALSLEKLKGKGLISDSAFRETRNKIEQELDGLEDALRGNNSQSYPRSSYSASKSSDYEIKRPRWRS